MKAVLFDYGLTLVSFAFPRRRLLEAMALAGPWLAADLGHAAPEPEWLVARVLEPMEDRLQGPTDEEPPWLDTYQEGWRAAGLDLSRETLYRVLDLEQQVWDQAVEVDAAAIPTLSELRRRGVRTGLCSNAPFPPELMRRQLRNHGLESELDGVVFSSDVGRRKPSPEIYRAALAAVGASAAETLFVGDRPDFDYEVPRALGMQAILYSGFHPIPAGYPSIDRLEQVLELI